METSKSSKYSKVGQLGNWSPDYSSPRIAISTGLFIFVDFNQIWHMSSLLGCNFIEADFCCNKLVLQEKIGYNIFTKLISTSNQSG